jgi:hypothetical protein
MVAESAPWASVLRANPTEWLLTSRDPAVRYFTLTDVLDRPVGDPEVCAARAAIMDSPLVHLTLKRQKCDGRWGRRRRAYDETVWRLLLLGEVGATPNEAIRLGCEYVTSAGQISDGGFSYNGETNGILPCFTANAIQFLVNFGYADDPRVQKAVDSLVQQQLDEGGWLCTGRVRKSSSCLWGTAKALRTFRSLPADLRSPLVEQAERQAVDLLLDLGLYRANPRDWGSPHRHWFLVGFPLLMESDILEMLTLVAPFVEPDEPRIQEGLDLVLAKQDAHGRWPLEKTIYIRNTGEILWQLADEVDRRRLIARRNDPTAVEPLGALGRPNPWVTLDALRMLKRLHASA